MCFAMVAATVDQQPRMQKTVGVAVVVQDCLIAPIFDFKIPEDS